MKKQWLILLCVVLCVFVFSCGIAAATPDYPNATAENKVHVVIENTTFNEDVAKEMDEIWNESYWTGTLVDYWVDIDENSSMISCVKAALDFYGKDYVVYDPCYVHSINGLSEFDGGSRSGWMGTINDWFVHQGLDQFTVADGTLEAGDEIRISYTCELGEDLGSSFGGTDTTLKNLAFSVGDLTPAFSADVNEYVLTVPAATKSVTVVPTAGNKNYQVRTYVGDTEYKRTMAVPVENGTKITVKCGDPSWPSMNTPTTPTVYTVTVVTPDVEKPEVKLPFKDLNEDAWYMDSIRYVYTNDIMNGVTSATFEPDSTLTRGMYITMLYRLSGAPEVNGKIAYDDVKTEDWFAKAVVWGTEKGVVEGYAGKFSPDDKITREQMAAMMYRYAEWNGCDVSATASFDKFTDGKSVSDWAKEEMGWAVASKLIQGLDDGSLNPQGDATRAQAATVLQRFAETIVK